MRHSKRKDFRVTDPSGCARLKDVKTGWRQLARGVALSVHQIEEPANFLLGIGRPANFERVLSFPLKKIFDEKKRQPAEVVAMQMAQNNRIDAARIDSSLLQREECRRS